jgi:hypothetical protein
MLPHQGYSRPENPKRHGFDSSIKLSPLQNYGIMNLQNRQLSDRASVIIVIGFTDFCKTELLFFGISLLPIPFIQKEILIVDYEQIQILSVALVHAQETFSWMDT